MGLVILLVLSLISVAVLLQDDGNEDGENGIPTFPDLDDDGIPDDEDLDRDGDGALDYIDNCPEQANPAQTNSDAILPDLLTANFTQSNDHKSYHEEIRARIDRVKKRILSRR